MKKIISMLMVVMLLTAMAIVPASAFTIGAADSPDGSSSGNVSISVNGTPVHKYAIEITFDDLKFTYSTGSTWNPSTHTYDVNDGGTWSADQKVSIHNHSDQSIAYEVAIDGAVSTDYGELSINLGANASSTLEACTSGTANGSEPSADVSIGVTGTPNQSELQDKTLGTVKVTISKP